MTANTSVDPVVLTTAIQAAVRAPSMHNVQPWRFRITPTHLDVYADPARRLPASDPNGWAVRVACGAAVYNARLALAMAEHPAEVRLRPDPAQPDLMARLVPGPARPPSPHEVRLHAAILGRHSNRRPFRADPVPAEIRARLVLAARAEGGWLELLIGRMPLAGLAEVVRGAQAALDRDDGYRAELAAWSRRRDADDGIPVSSSGPHPESYDLLALRDFGGPPRPSGRDYESDPLIAVLGTVADTPNDQLNAGQALQAVLLSATADGVATSMISQPIEVPAARDQLRRSLGRSGTPQMVLRVGYGEPGYPTPRRPLADVIDD